MAHSDALECQIEELQARPAEDAPAKGALEHKIRELSKVKLMKPFEYSHQGHYPSQ